MANWAIGFEAVFALLPLMLLLIGVTLGVVVGALPGLTATMSVAVLLPFTFSLDPVPGMMLLLGVYGGALYAGSIPAILIKTPGTPSAAATVLDGYPMASDGRAGQGLTISVIASGVGGIIGALLLGFFSPSLADLALSLNAPHIFMITVFALTVIASISEGFLIKGLLTGTLGIAISLVGLDPMQGYPRMTFGIDQAVAGFALIPVLIGVFGVGEGLSKFEQLRKGSRPRTPIGSFWPPRDELRLIGWPIGGSSVLGFGVGVLPGVGGDIGAFVAYNETKRMAKKNPRFGKGDPRGVAAAESANSASTAGALVPLLTLGIPGDTVGAILLGAITVHGLRPGPELFSGSPDLVYGMFVGFILVYLAIIAIGLLGVRMWARVLQLRTEFLWPAVLVLCVVGSFALRNSLFDVTVMLFSGIVGYLLMKGRYPLAPLVIGLIIGPIMERNYRRTMTIHRGSFDWLLDPIVVTLIVMIVAALVLAVTRARRDRSKQDQPIAPEAPGT